MSLGLLSCTHTIRLTLDMILALIFEILQYLQWAGLDPMADADRFWTSPRVKQLYMNHVRVLFNRRNVYTGRLYKVTRMVLEAQVVSHFA